VLKSSRSNSETRRALSLIELMITIAIIGILAAAILPQFGTTATDHLRGISQIVASDIDYARSLAIANGTSYEIDWSTSADTYTLTHSGTNTNFDNLPDSPFRRPGADGTSLVVDLNDLPSFGASLSIVSVVTDESTPTHLDSTEFNPLGETTEEQPTIIWLGSSSGDRPLYVPIQINPITGISEIGDITTVTPPIQST